MREVHHATDFQAVFEAVPGLYLVLLPDVPRYTIVAVSDAYARATMTKREEIVGRGIFEVVPDKPVDTTATRVGNLSASLGRVLSKRAADTMAVQKHGVLRPVETGGAFEERWWSPMNSPVFGAGGEIAYIIHVVEDVTEKRHLQEETQRFAAAEHTRLLAMTERERLLALAESLFELASDSIFIADTDGRYTEVNAAACQMLGYSREELVSKTMVDIIPSEDVLRLATTREHLLASGTVQVADWTLLRKDGSPIPVEVSAKILPDGRWQAFVRDISERKRIETELRDANAFLDAIIENIPLMLFIKDSASFRFVRINREGEHLLGWSNATLIGKSAFDFWPPEQAAFFVEKDRETMKSGKVLDIPEEPIETRLQGVRYLHTKKVPILDSSGNPLYLLGISEDITERKRLEEQRRFLTDVGVAVSASLDYQETLATVARLAVHRVADWCAVDVLEEPGRLRRVKVASADPADAALCTVLERMPTDRALPYLARSVFESGRPIVERVTPKYLEWIAQGPEHLEALRATRITSFIGVPLLLHRRALGVLLFGSTSQERVYGRGDLRWAEAVADRCAVAVENARLYRASVAASQLRDQVLGVVAHDLRNPLSTILLQESVLREHRGPGRELDAIHRAATRMSRLIQDLLDISLVEAGHLAIQKARLSPRDLVVEGLELQKGLTASSVELCIDVESDTPEVWGDRDRLLRVFENLIGNAIKFTAPGGRITVGTALKGHSVVFWVADEGVGIAPAALPHVFERFWQATRGDRRGAGLGLQIVKGIVEAHGGHVWVQSTLGRGTTFYFSIPTADLAADQAAPSIH